MINLNEVLETNKMIEQENLDVLLCFWKKIMMHFVMKRGIFIRTRKIEKKD